MELSRGDKQKQTDWKTSKARETLRGVSTELLTEADTRMESGEVHVMYALSMAFRKKDVTAARLKEIITMDAPRAKKGGSTTEKEVSALPGSRSRDHVVMSAE